MLIYLLTACAVIALSAFLFHQVLRRFSVSLIQLVHLALCAVTAVVLSYIAPKYLFNLIGLQESLVLLFILAFVAALVIAKFDLRIQNRQVSSESVQVEQSVTEQDQELSPLSTVLEQNLEISATNNAVELVYSVHQSDEHPLIPESDVVNSDKDEKLLADIQDSTISASDVVSEHQGIVELGSNVEEQDVSSESNPVPAPFSPADEQTSISILQDPPSRFSLTREYVEDQSITDPAIREPITVLQEQEFSLEDRSVFANADSHTEVQPILSEQTIAPIAPTVAFSIENEQISAPIAKQVSGTAQSIDPSIDCGANLSSQLSQSNTVDLDVIHTQEQLQPPTFDDLINQAFVYRESGHIQLALTSFQQAIDIDPGNQASMFIRVEISNLFKNQGQFDQAIRELTMAQRDCQTCNDQSMIQEFENSIAYLKIVKIILERHQLGAVPYGDINDAIKNEIDTSFKYWKNHYLKH